MKLRSLFLVPAWVWLAVLFAAPFAIVLDYSFLTRGVYGGVEQPWTLENYTRLLDPLYLSILVRSFAMALAATAVCLALASSLSGQPLPAQMVALGEVGLGGELRQVNGMPKRLAEARRLGFGDALVPTSAQRPTRPEPGVARDRRRELPASTLRQALALALGAGPAQLPGGAPGTGTRAAPVMGQPSGDQ